jgi:hypothetical protein
MIKITNKKQLDLFLQKITRNATIKAKRSLFESPDPYIDKFEDDLKDELGELQEQEGTAEEPEDEEEEESADDATDKEPTDEPDADNEESDDESTDSKKNPAAEKALSLIDYEEDFDVSFENVVTALNTLRAGKSTKNKDIQTELSDYYERLSDDEKAVLLLYLNELSKVLTGAVDGDTAQDPSDPSTYFNIRKRDKDEPNIDDEPKTSSPEQGAEKSDVQSTEQDDSLKQQKGAEDTTPPIKVNESQDIRSVYKKFKSING